MERAASVPLTAEITSKLNKANGSRALFPYTLPLTTYGREIRNRATQSPLQQEIFVRLL